MVVVVVAVSTRTINETDLGFSNFFFGFWFSQRIPGPILWKILKSNSRSDACLFITKRFFNLNYLSKTSLQLRYKQELKHQLLIEISSLNNKHNQQEIERKQELQQIQVKQQESLKKVEKDAYDHFSNLHFEHKEHFEKEYKKLLDEKERVLREVVNIQITKKLFKFVPREGILWERNLKLYFSSKRLPEFI
jgi:hypothetical protein